VVGKSTAATLPSGRRAFFFVRTEYVLDQETPAVPFQVIVVFARMISLLLLL
jgi:hypothetical protein